MEDDEAKVRERYSPASLALTILLETFRRVQGSKAISALRRNACSGHGYAASVLPTGSSCIVWSGYRKWGDGDGRRDRAA
jgi:hypothetical protein